MMSRNQAASQNPYYSHFPFVVAYEEPPEDTCLQGPNGIFVEGLRLEGV